MAHLDPLKVTYAPGTGIPDGHLSLCWNNHRSTFYHVISSLRLKERYSDVTIACEGKFYPVHKLILSICSEYFDAMLERTPCKHPVIVLRDVHPDDLEALLAFMYDGFVSVAQNDLGRLIKTAEMLRIKGLAVPDDPLSASVDGRRVNTMSSPLVATTIPVRQARECKASPQSKRKKREENGGIFPDVNPTSVDEITINNYERHQQRATRVDFHRDHLKEVPQATEVVVAEEIKDESMDSSDQQLHKGATTATLIGTYGVVVSDGTTHHTLVSHPQDPNQVIAHRYETAIAPGTHQPHTQPLAEAVAEALAGPSGMPSWLSSTELVPASFATVEAYSTEANETPSTQTIVHTLGNSQATVVDVSNVPTSIATSAPLIIENNVMNPGQTSTNTNSSTSSSRSEGNHLKCHYCQRSTFRQTSDLKRHIRIHTGEKPFKCAFCPYKASRKDLLHAHSTKMHNTQ